uniref:Secreted protein n=1 Tax=Rhizochromulina marina TaxID=1034831 RepID=A0A7S2W5G3_9STRA|mmetsp:Transcript_14313/g.42225  ORF Transcript_14313/g.42225 Transcript_14313/m.42225 type:complete len:117 (+) Transcript_14313:126-476(+)
MFILTLFQCLPLTLAFLLSRPRLELESVVRYLDAQSQEGGAPLLASWSDFIWPGLSRGGGAFQRALSLVHLDHHYVRAKKGEPNSSLPGLDLSYELTRFIFITKGNSDTRVTSSIR